MDKPNEASSRLEKLENDIAEAQARTVERLPSIKPEKPPVTELTDRAGRSIAVKCWESSEQMFVRAYDTVKLPVPENIDRGTAGLANARLERPINGTGTRVYLQDIEVPPEYQRAGIATAMLDQVEQFGYKHGASEIYGLITEPEALSFWSKQGDCGWDIQQNGKRWEIHKRL